MSKQEREMHRRVQEYLARLRVQDGLGGSDASKSGTPIGKSFGNKIIFERTHNGTVSYIAPEPANTLMFLRGGSFRRGGNIELPEEYASNRADELIALISDGSKWYEFSRSQSGARDFIPVSDFNIYPDTGADVTALIQIALDTMEEGKTLYFSPGLYLISSSLTISRSNIGIWLDPGVVIQQTNGLAVFDHVGTLSANPMTLTIADVTPGLYTFVVADASDLSDGQWIRLYDTKIAFTLGAGDRDHMELLQIDSIAGNVITLKHPVLDTYTTAAAAQVQGVAPVENVTIMGYGAMTNPQDGVDQGKVVRYEYAVNCTIQDAEIYEFGLEAVGYIKSAHCRATNLRIHDATRFNEPTFGPDGYGYGITSRESHNLLWDHNRITRTRHAIDPGWFSQQVTAIGNIIKAQASTAIQTHPNTRGITFALNEVDGVVGYDTTGVEFGGEEGSGIGIRQGCVGALVALNTLQTIYGSGLTVAADDCEDIELIGNTLDGINLENSLNHAGIRVYGAADTNTCPGLIVRDNLLKNFLRCGIMVGFDNAAIDNNIIRNTAGATYGIAVQSRVDVAGVGVPVSDVALTRNKIYGGTKGIWLGGDSAGSGVTGRLIHNTRIEENEIYDTVDEGIGHETNSMQHYSTGGRIKRNKIGRCNSGSSTDRGGIALIESATVAPTLFKYTIEGNEIFGGRNGIRAIGTGTKILRNDIHDITTAFGIYVAATSGAVVADDILLQGNVIRNCASDGIRVGGDAGGTTDVRLFENECNDNGAYGIRIEADAVGTVIRNPWCDGNATAPFLIGATVRFYDTAGAVVGVADTAPAIALTTRTVRYTTLTAARAPTLPAANVVGHEVWIEDSSGAASAVNTITPTAIGADVFDDTAAAAGPPIAAPYGSIHVRCVAAGFWKVL